MYLLLRNIWQGTKYLAHLYNNMQFIKLNHKQFQGTGCYKERAQEKLHQATDDRKLILR